MKKKNFLKIIDQIEQCRSKNNSNWMNVLRLAYSKAPEESVKIFSQIYKEDKKISSLARKLTKKK